MILPDRLTSLMRRIEAGETVTRHELDRLAALQRLDMALLGRQALSESTEANQKQIDFIEKAS